MRRLISRILHVTNGLALCHLDTKAGGSKNRRKTRNNKRPVNPSTVSQVARKEDLEDFRRHKIRGNWQEILGEMVWQGDTFDTFPFFPMLQSWKT